MSGEKKHPDYLNFDLLIERSGNSYVARVTQSPAGEAVAPFRLPFAEMELENFLLKIGRPRRGIRRFNSPESDAAKNFGRCLFEAVFTSEVFGCFRSSLDRAEEKESGLRIRLRLNAPALADLPWEYLYYPALNRFLVLAVETPLVRYIELPERIRPLAVQPPLKILVMISSPHDYAPLDVEQEWHKLREALATLQKRGLVELERLEEATLAALQRRLRQGVYHIFHFIGHGVFDESAQDGVLLLEDEARRGRRVSGQDLGTILHNHRQFRLAILNACEGARTSRRDPFTGAAQSLVQQGIPAVIAMQFEITDAAAITFAHEFYTALADGYPVDAAVVEARAAIFAGGNDMEWGTPVLYMRSPDGRIFDLERKTWVAVEPERVQKPSGRSQRPEGNPPITEALQPTPTRPVVEKEKKPVSPPSPPPEIKPRRAGRRPLIITATVLAMFLLIYFVVKDRSTSPDESAVPGKKSAMTASDSLYLQYKNAGDASFYKSDFDNAKRQYQLALQQKPDDRYVAQKIQECNRLLAQEPQEKTPPETPSGMVRIPAGSFMMGSDDGDSNEKPVHEVYVDAFYMDKTEVTVAQYQRFLNAVNRQQPEQWNDQLQDPNRPVVYVSWEDANAYAKWAGKRLPTEAEWEYAARGDYTGVGGKPKYKYPWGDDASPGKANFDADNSRTYSWENAKRYLKDVGSYAANGFGLNDMAGNVWEWCADWYAPDYYQNSPKQNPKGLSTGSNRVLRGGSWGGFARRCRSANRFRSGPGNRSNDVGFRLVFVP